MSFKRLSIGKKGEDEAVKELIKRGYQILIRNYRCRIGEIDIIAQHGDKLVFIEVRSKTSFAYGSPQESVNLKKQQKIIKVAQMFLAEKKKFNSAIRFDVVAVLMDKDGNVRKLEILDNAF